MLTFGLNRPLYSFGLSYPGYFFVVVPDDGEKFTIYKVHESNRYRAAELANAFIARHATVYIAHPVPGETATDYYAAAEAVRQYIATELTTFIVLGESFSFVADQDEPQFAAIEANSFKAAEDERVFSAIEITEYAEVYRT